MTPERWQHIKEIFYGALECSPSERASFLESACAGDEAARNEVSQLISAHEHEETGEFLNMPAYEAAAELLVHDHCLLAGQKVRHYQITDALGTGGMGEVYLARDERLRRNVALKLLPRTFMQDAERLRRFEEEARAAAALAHPNVCVVHEVGEAEDGRRFIAMEYVEGETLRAWLRREHIKLGEALDVAAQIAAALTDAHAHGIVHRDIKPENVMLRADGLVKVLDFGIAKLTVQPASDDVETLKLALVKTGAGQLMGTTAYMSPEQARGLEVDARTDIWSLGVVLYEMIAGHAPFGGKTASDVLVSILEREPPPLSHESGDVPAELERIVRKALEKDREERYQVVKDLALDLKGLRHGLAFEAELERAVQASSDSDLGNYRRLKRSPRSGTQKADPVAVHDEARLNSWEDIAAYLDTSVRTVQRWERTEGLPVHRHGHARAATIYVYTSEVDAWFRGRDNRFRRAVDAPLDAKVDPKRLIVLPFRLINADPEIEYLSLGLADAITASLSGHDQLMVRSSLVAAKYAGEIDLERISRESAVDLVLIGTLLRSGDQLRVTAQLVDAASGTAISSQTTQGSLRDVFQLQDQVVTRILDSIALPLNAQEQRLSSQDVPASQAAYEYYLRGNELAYDFDPAARDFYIRSVEEDPNYAPAWSRLGRCSRIIAKFGGDPENFSRAEAALARALELRPNLALAHNQLAYLEADSNLADRALERLLSRAQAVRNDPELFAGLVHVCRYCGLLEASVAAHEHARQMDPTIRTSVCHTHFMLGDYHLALEMSREVLGYIGPLALMCLGREHEAVVLARRMEGTSTPLPLVRCFFSSARALAEGARAEAVALSERAIALITRGPEELFQQARHLAYLSQHDRALAILARAVDEGFFCYPALVRDPWLYPLRPNPEFEAILRRALKRHAAAVRVFVQAGGERILGALPTARATAKE